MTVNKEKRIEHWSIGDRGVYAASHLPGHYEDRCPECGGMLDNIYDVFVATDYSTDWQFTCPHCDKVILVDVVSVPSFQLYKTTTKSHVFGR